MSTRKQAMYVVITLLLYFANNSVGQFLAKLGIGEVSRESLYGSLYGIPLGMLIAYENGILLTIYFL